MRTTLIPSSLIHAGLVGGAPAPAREQSGRRPAARVSLEMCGDESAVVRAPTLRRQAGIATGLMSCPACNELSRLIRYHISL
jgi:hypothetical protein